MGLGGLSHPAQQEPPWCQGAGLNMAKPSLSALKTAPAPRTTVKNLLSTKEYKGFQAQLGPSPPHTHFFFPERSQNAPRCLGNTEQRVLLKGIFARCLAMISALKTLQSEQLRSRANAKLSPFNARKEANPHFLMIMSTMRNTFTDMI